MPKRSAGILLWRRSPGLQVLLAHPGGPLFTRKDDGHWTLPKGELDPGEEPLAAAYREFTEETGIAPPAAPAVPLGDITQKSGKVVTAWAVEGDLDVDAIDPGTFEMTWRGRVQSFPEIDRVQWFSPAEAAVKLMPAQVAFVRRLEEVL
ncbi:MAG: NUDIX domain-containing protein [Actinobacteria bacterium]|nr:NUDIX domain-containing protein [Actinomycetota bacterium]MCA1721053.1 NUDIX domain-containing protein [Actinomycetota bacterium]